MKVIEMRSNNVRIVRIVRLSVVLAIVLGVVALSPKPAHAVSAAIGKFYATCGFFSVDVAVNGINAEQNGLDRFRYQITDGSGKILYLEDATRPVNNTQSSLVINMPYTALPPTKNPIQFTVVELDGGGNPGAFIQEVRYDAKCLAATGNVNRTGDFLPPQFLKATFVATTGIFTSPGAGEVNGVQIVQGKEFYAVYRSADNKWVAVSIGGSDIFWVPAGAVTVDMRRLNTPPTRIDGNSPAVLTTTGGPTAGQTPIAIPSGVIATASADVRFREGPSVRSTILDVLPLGTSVPVLGTNQSRTFVKVVFSGRQGWISSRFIELTGAYLNQLPIVQ